jgi:CRISPR-associated protein Csb1
VTIISDGSPDTTNNKNKEEKNMSTLDLDRLLEACSPGGPSCLSVRTELVPAGGPEASVAPAKYALEAKKSSAYVYEKRFVGGEVRDTVLIDSKQSQINRVEAALLQAIAEGHEILKDLPRIEVVYQRDGVEKRYSDLKLPHRAFDGHIRAGEVERGEEKIHVVDDKFYQSVRNATYANARALLDASPATLIFGGWDASRKRNQGRWRSVLVGEVIGVCANTEPSKRGGARIDPMGASINLSLEELQDLAERQHAELSNGDGAKASVLGLGGIPPTLNQLGGVACERIIRSQVLSFATLRQMRFGGNSEADVACRALLAAIALYGLARANSELYFRANCDLREAGPAEVLIDKRNGEVESFEPLQVEAMDALLAAAFSYAVQHAKVEFNGVALTVIGDPRIEERATDEPSDIADGQQATDEGQQATDEAAVNEVVDDTEGDEE